MNIAEKIIDIVKGMEGIGGVPTDREFLDEFEFRLQSLKQEQTLPLDSFSGSVISELSDEQKFHITLIARLNAELINEQIITPTQKSQIEKYMLCKI
jgi:hypothetical protein